MIGRRFRNLLLLAAAAGLAYLIVHNRVTIPGLVDRVTAPLFQSKAAVEESEHKRIEAEAAPVIERSQDAIVGTLHERMTRAEVRDLLGAPDSIEEIPPKGRKVRSRWTYRRIGRVIDFEDGRVVSIAIR